MKNTRKFLAIFMVIAMIMSMGVLNAFADAESVHYITIENENPGYEYAAYQIFSGNLTEDGKELQNLAWGSGIDSEKYNDLIADLNEIEAFADCKNVVDVATVLGKISTSNHATTMAFADVVSKYLNTTSVAGSAGANQYDETKKQYVFDVTGDGYYLVKNTSVPEGETDTTWTRYILKVFGDTTITHKGDFPEVEKKIVENEYLEVDANTSEIGKTINYKFTGTVPTNIADYDTYYYVFTDTMSKGLTYANNLKVTVNGKDVTDYFYANDEEGTDIDGNETTVLTVGIEDLLALELITDDLDPVAEGTQTVGDITKDTTVVVTYDAFVNENAVIGTSGNTNDVDLTYSNDPNNDGEGAKNPPEPGPGEPSTTNPTGETPKDLVVTFLTEIKLLKVDGLTNEKLTGAKFKIEGLSSEVAVINKEMFVPYKENEGLEVDVNNVWYRLKDGTYTQTKAGEIADYEAYTGTELAEGLTYYTKNGDSYVEYTGDEFQEGLYTAITYSADEYDDETKTYMKVTELDVVNIDATFTKEGWVDEDGILTFTGLGEGTYTITEIIAPDGYNKLEESITVEIEATVDDVDVTELPAEINPTANTKVTWTATGNPEDTEGNWTVENGVIKITVKNTSGSTLPSTGSIGTTIFYVAGGIMVVAAVIFLVTKKRMKNAEN